MLMHNYCYILEPDEHGVNGREKRLYIMYVEHVGQILLIICELAATVNKKMKHMNGNVLLDKRTGSGAMQKKV